MKCDKIPQSQCPRMIIDPIKSIFSAPGTTDFSLCPLIMQLLNHVSIVKYFILPSNESMITRKSCPLESASERKAYKIQSRIFYRLNKSLTMNSGRSLKIHIFIRCGSFVMFDEHFFFLSTPDGVFVIIICI